MVAFSFLFRDNQNVIINVNEHKIIVNNNLKNDSERNIDGIIPIHKTAMDKIMQGFDTV